MTKNEIDTVLRSADGDAQGTKVHGTPAQLAEVRKLGLIGERDGLTRKGSIRLERVRNAALDAAFGPL